MELSVKFYADQFISYYSYYLLNNYINYNIIYIIDKTFGDGFLKIIILDYMTGPKIIRNHKQILK